MNKYIVGLDIGTTKIACFIGERAQNNKIRIVGFGKTESLGVDRGMVRNITDAAKSIRRAVEAASNMAKYEVTEVYVGIAGQHIKSRQNQGTIMISEEHPRISQSDIDRLIADQHHVMLNPVEEIIHVFPQEFEVDGEPLGFGIEPVGMNGKQLKANFHVVTGDVSSIRNIRDAVYDAGLKIKGVVLEPVASSYAVLDERDRDAGVALVDIGGGTTDIAVFQDRIIRHTSVLPLAGSVVTSDIKAKCKILRDQAESLKVKFGTCLPNSVNQDDIIAIPMSHDREPREISVRTLAEIIRGRMKMLYEQVDLEITLSQYREQLINGVVLTGGGSNLDGMREYGEMMLGLDCRIGKPDMHIDTQSSVTFEDFSHPMYATGIGLVIYGILEAEDEAEMAQAQAQQSAAPAPEQTAEPEVEEPQNQGSAEDETKPARKSPFGRKSKEPKQPKRPKANDGFAGSFNRMMNKFFSDPDIESEE